MYQMNVQPNRFASLLRAGTVFALFCLCAITTVKAQQEEQVVKFSTREGLLEISARNQSEQDRLITVKLDGQILKRFKTHFGDWLDILASYTAGDATYVVLRTNIGNGACGGTGGLYVLTFDESDIPPKQLLPVAISPILEACLGDTPTVKFDLDNQGNEIIFVNEYELRNNRWIRERKRRRR